MSHLREPTEESVAGGPCCSSSFEGTAGGSNYLPICRQCNGLRGGYRPKVLRLILRLGVTAKQEIRHDTDVGRKMARLVYRQLRNNKKRRLR